MDICYYLKAMILNDHITYEESLSNLSLAGRRGNTTRTSARPFATASPGPCSVQAREAATSPCCLPPRGRRGASAASDVAVGESWRGGAWDSPLRGLVWGTTARSGADSPRWHQPFALSSHTRARVAAAGPDGPELPHMPRGCFLKMAAGLRHSLPKAGVDAGSQRLGKLAVEQSTKGGEKKLGTHTPPKPQSHQLRVASGQKLGE